MYLDLGPPLSENVFPRINRAQTKNNYLFGSVDDKKRYFFRMALTPCPPSLHSPHEYEHYQLTPLYYKGWGGFPT